MGEKRLPFVIMSLEKDEMLDDAFEFGIKEAIKQVLRLSDEDIRKIRIDEAITAEKELPWIPDKILSSIENSLFVICDTTGNRPNCYFELGYALALKKHIFLIHRKDSEPPHFDIRGRPIIFYKGAKKLCEELVKVISLHFGKPFPSSPKVADFFDRCGLPIAPLEGDAKYDYDIDEMGQIPITLNYATNKKYSVPQQWRKVFNSILSKQLKNAEKKGDVIFNGDLIRVRDYCPSRDERTGARFIRIDIEPTDYFTFISSNHAWALLEKPMLTSLRKHEKRNVRNLRDSILANPLTVSVSVILEYNHKEWILIQERNTRKTFHCKYKFQCSAAGMVNAYRDRRTHGVDVFATAKNEVEEELGMTFKEEQITFLGLLRETKNYEVGLVAEVHTARDPNKVLCPRADQFEVVQVLLCELTPETFAEFLLKYGGIENFVPLGIGAIVYSLLKRYPANRIEKSMHSLK